MRPMFVGEAIVPVPGTFLLSRAAPGEPGLPERFSWRGKEYSVAAVLEQWKEAGDCRHGSGERYVRKHWYRVHTTEGVEMRIYFERQRRFGGSRWRLHTLQPAPAGRTIGGRAA